MSRLFFFQAFVLALLALLYVYFGIYEGYVFTVFWFDILLHFLGGFWIALSVAWLSALFGVRLSLWQLFFVVLAVGLAWELFEYVFDIGGSNFMSYEADTIKDIIDDLLGGVFGAVLARELLTQSA